MSDVNPCFSEDVWFEILKELPVKMLGKCRCVCKSWCSLVASPSFMLAHLKHYTQNESNSLLLHKCYYDCSKPGQYEQCILYRDFDQLKEGNGKINLHTSICPFMLPDHWTARLDLVGSVHGLICLSDALFLTSTIRIIIWNPLLQKYIMLPESQAVETSKERPVLGFGYDCRKNDHIVVKLSDCRGLTLVEVYSVQERAWRASSSDYLVQNSINNVSTTQCFFNGFIHWLTIEDERGDQWIPFDIGLRPSRAKWVLFFNVAEETFGKMLLPETFMEANKGTLGVFEYQSQLSVSRCWYDSMDGNILFNCEIWVKKEHNVDSSWSKIVHVGSLNDCIHKGPVQYLGKNGELVGFVKQSTRELISFDHYDTSLSRKTKGLGVFVSATTRFRAYSESLVLLDQTIDALTAEELERPAFTL